MATHLREPHQAVFVTRRLPGSALERLAQFCEVECWPSDDPPSPAELLEHAMDKDGLLTLLTDRVDAALVTSCPRLRVVSNMAVGVDNVDIAALSRRKIALGHTPGVLTEATADLTFALALALARRLVEARQALLDGAWTTWQPGAYLGLELSGARFGIVGMGRIGAAVARRAMGFGCEVVATSRTAPPVEGVSYLGLDELLSSSDIVSLHVALTPDTRHLIGARELALMKDEALLVNTARGSIIDEDALYEALVSGQIAGAALDVFEREPIDRNDPLVHLGNCLALPHIGSATRATREKMADLAVDNLIAGLRGEPLIACANAKDL